jgi:hypothetical protein
MPIIHEPPSVRLTQQGLTWWQPSERRDKNHCVNLVLSVGLHFPLDKLVFTFIFIVLV